MDKDNKKYKTEILKEMMQNKEKNLADSLTKS